MAQRDEELPGGAVALAWMPLLAGAINSYGPIAYNYGFALYFLDYRHGFVKRGLVGEMFSRVAWMPHDVLVGIQYGFLAAAFALTYVVFRKVLFGDAAERRLAAALLAAPALLPHLGFLFAQPDVTMYMLLLGAFAALVWMRPATGAAVSCALCCTALLAHEAFSLMFYPLVAAILLQMCARGRLRWAAGLAHIAVVTAAFLAILHFGALKVSPDVVLHEAEARTNVGVQRQVYDVMASTLAEQRALLQQMYSPYVEHVFELTAAITSAYFGLLGWLMLGAMKRAGAGRAQQAVTAAMFVSPMALCWLGHDVSRWIGAVGIDATLFVLYLYMTEPEESASRVFLRGWANGPGYPAWVIYLLAIGPLGATGIRSAEQIVHAWIGP